MRLALVPFILGPLLAACTLTSDSFAPKRFVGNLESVGAGGGISIGTPPIEDGGISGSPECTTETERPECVVLLAPAGNACGSDLECQSQVCAQGACAAPSCDDGRRNGGEAGVDCGADCPAACATGSCNDDLDCASQSCQAGRCADATCSDLIRNQGEADVDCAGPCATSCADGDACESDADCGSGLFCPEQTGRCTNVSCQDDTLNGEEILVDCGGGCPGCPVGTPCTEDADCETLVCGGNGTCSAASCDDGVNNQNEADTDCGGNCGSTCEVSDDCGSAADCESGVCGFAGCGADTERCCQAPTCTDGILNGAEPVVDCGNAACGLCAIGRVCTANAQCQSTLCQGGRCVVQACADGQLNGTETDEDCGGADARCRRCSPGESCNGNTDCAAPATCVNGECEACGDGQRNGSESDVDCGGVCGKCAPGRLCNEDADCDSGSDRDACEDGRCCGGSTVDCTRCARRLSFDLTCDIPNDGNATGNCNAFLDCMANNPGACPVRHAGGCSEDPGGVCNHTFFGGNQGQGLIRADNILGTAGCAF